jgi:hypothetical protein
MRRFLFGCMAAVVSLTLVSTNVRAAVIPLPTTLDNLTIAGNTAINGNLVFSAFQYTVNPAGTPPPDSGVTVNPFSIAGNETGITFTGFFYAGPGTVVNYDFDYVVSTLDGSLITDAYLSAAGGNFNGTGAYSVGETYVDAHTGDGLLQLQVSSFKAVDFGLLAFGTNSVRVHKSVLLVGGSNGATVGIINQGFSQAIPEPTSMALLGIGLSGLVTFRRFFKRTSVA